MTRASTVTSPALDSWIAAAEASRFLGVNRATLYAYVSRGYLRSQAVPGSHRERRYSRDDLERMKQRAEERRDPGKAAARALSWGIPVLESSIALIDGTRLYYRGHDAVALSRSRSVGEVASLIWSGDFSATFPGIQLSRPVSFRRIKHLTFVGRAQSILARASAEDPLAFDLRAGSVALAGWRILTLLTLSATQADIAGSTFDQILARAWQVKPRGLDVLRGALILCGDHELNVSSFTARCVASAGSNPYAVVIAALAALEGTRHGGATLRVAAMLESMRRLPLTRAVNERVRRGEPIDGFGHPLYRNGDPRAVALLDLIRERYPKSSELSFVLDVADTVGSTMRERPTIDFALVAAARVLRLPPGAPLMLFAIGRTIGWVGHAIEQYATGQLIRPRAKYVGAVP
jgi:citrate synthase